MVGDLLCMLIFAVLGLRSHEDGITFGGILRAATPFQAGWLIVIGAIGVQRRPEPSDSRGLIRAWIPAWALGLVIRAVLFDGSLEVTFAIVSLLVIGVLLMLWRGVLAPILLRRRG